MEAMYRGWRDPLRHHDFPLPEGFRIVGHERPYWSFLLPPGWRSQSGKKLTDVIAFQWTESHRRCLEDTADLQDRRYLRVSLEDLLADPVALLTSISNWADLDPRPFERFSRGLPRINAAKHLVADHPSEHDIETAVASAADIARRLGYD
jgi:hypothetical protein